MKIRICALRGRKRGDRYIQHLDLGGVISNTLTTVDKDNYIMEIEEIEDINITNLESYRELIREKLGSDLDELRKQYDFRFSDGWSVDAAIAADLRKALTPPIPPTRPRPQGKGWVWDERDKKWFRIRRLTPREAFRLMGVSEPDIDKIRDAGISDSQQYKMAGNSIVVDCLAAIFKQLFLPDEKQERTLF